MKNNGTMKLTDEEYEKIIKEIANRWKNLAYINAENLIKRQLSKTTLETSLDKDWSTELTFSLCLLVNDMREIIGGIRRCNEENCN